MAKIRACLMFLLFMIPPALTVWAAERGAAAKDDAVEKSRKAQEPAKKEKGKAGGKDDVVDIVVTADRDKKKRAEGTAANGYRYSKARLGPLGQAALKDIPYSVNVTSGELIENRNAHNPTDALKTNPTVVPLMSSGGYSTMHRVMIRGFNACDQSELRDGMVDRSFSLPPMENVDRVEVLNGLSGFLYGFSAVGGSVNYVTKKPLDKRYAALSTGVYDETLGFLHADLGGPVGVDDLTYRLNLYGEKGGTYIDEGEQERFLASGALRYRVTDNVELTASIYHQQLRAESIETYFDIRGINYDVPDAFDPTEQYGQPWTHNHAWKTVGDLGIVAKVNEHVTVRAACRIGDMRRDYCFVSAKLTDTIGNYTETFVDSYGNDETSTAAYALVDANFKTWKFKHHLTCGYTHWGFTFERGANLVVNMGPSHIDAPVSYRLPGRANGYDRRMDQLTHNVILGDRIELNENWQFLAGANYAVIDTHMHGVYASPLRPSRTVQDALTPSFGLIFKPIQAVSLYASYMEGLEQGRTAPATAVNANEMLDPSISTQYEAGVKATVLDRLDMSAALFQLNKVNQYLDRNNVYTQDGRQVHQGLEFLVSGKLIDRLTLIGGYTIMEAEIEESNNLLAEGETPVNVPEQQARAYLEYRLPTPSEMPGFITLIGGANYYGKRPVNIPNTEYIPDVITADTGLRYQYKDNLTFSFNVSNLLNKHYWSYYRQGSDGAGEDGLLLGAPRRFSAMLKYKF